MIIVRTSNSVLESFPVVNSPHQKRCSQPAHAEPLSALHDQPLRDFGLRRLRQRDHRVCDLVFLAAPLFAPHATARARPGCINAQWPTVSGRNSVPRLFERRNTKTQGSLRSQSPSTGADRRRNGHRLARNTREIRCNSSRTTRRFQKCCDMTCGAGISLYDRSSRPFATSSRVRATTGPPGSRFHRPARHACAD